MIKKHYLNIILVAMGLITAVYADTLILKDNTKITGEIIKEKDTFIIVLDELGEIQRIPRDKLAKISYGENDSSSNPHDKKIALTKKGGQLETENTNTPQNTETTKTKEENKPTLSFLIGGGLLGTSSFYDKRGPSFELYASINYTANKYISYGGKFIFTNLELSEPGPYVHNTSLMSYFSGLLVVKTFPFAGNFYFTSGLGLSKQHFFSNEALLPENHTPELALELGIGYQFSFLGFTTLGIEIGFLDNSFLTNPEMTHYSASVFLGFRIF